MPKPHYQLYHNPRCSKSREVLAYLQSHDILVEIIEYLKTPPSTDTLKQLLIALGNWHPRQLMRSKESIYQEKHLDGDTLSVDALLEMMHQHPILIERPILVKDNSQAVIGRPPKNILSLL